MKIKKSISKCFMFSIFIFLFMLSFGFVNAVEYSTNITCNEDAYVYNNSADTNYGNSVDLYVRDNGDPERYDTNLEYIINDIPDDMTIDSASLCLYSDWINDSGKNVTIYYLTNLFSENIIKWSSDYRQYINYTYNVSYEFNNSDLDKYTCIDITDLLDYAYSEEEPLLDLIIIGSDNTTGSVKFNSKENTYPSYVEVNYSTDYSGVDYANWCKYNALKGGTVTTCNTIYSDNTCDKAFDAVKDVADGEWIGAIADVIPPFVAETIIEMDEPFYFDRLEIWQRVGYDYANGVGIEEFEINVYSPDTETWYLLLERGEGHDAKDGTQSNRFFGGEVDSGGTGYTMIPYLKDNDDLIYLGNLSISKVQLKVEKTLATAPTKIIFRELAFCVMGESESITDEVNFTGGIGYPCETDADCDTGLCEYGYCVFKRGGMECEDDGDCLSGECIDGKCTKEGLWDGIEASKNQQFGDDADSNNFIALFFIFGIAGFLMFYGNIIGGVFALYVLSIFFVVIGWLSPFILIGLVITGLIGVVFKIMVHSGGE